MEIQEESAIDTSLIYENDRNDNIGNNDNNKEVVVDEKVKKEFKTNIIFSCLWLCITILVTFGYYANIPKYEDEDVLTMISAALYFLPYILLYGFVTIPCIHASSINIILGCISIYLSKRNKKAAYIINSFAIVIHWIVVMLLCLYVILFGSMLVKLEIFHYIYIGISVVIGIIQGEFYAQSNKKYKEYFKNKDNKKDIKKSNDSVEKNKLVNDDETCHSSINLVENNNDKKLI